MNDKLKSIIERHDTRRRNEAIKAAEIAAEKKRAEEELLAKNKVKAKEWVEKHIYDLIEKAESENKDCVDLDERGYSNGQPSYDGIPAYLLADEVAKIDGLRIERRLVKGYKDIDYGEEPDRTVFEVWWKEAPPKMRNTYWG